MLRFEQRTKNPFEIKIDLGSHDSITSPRIIISTYVRFCFLFEFPLLLSGIWLAVTTAQNLNGLQSRQVSPPFACLPVSTSKPVKLVCMCVVITWDWDVCVCVSVSVTDRAIESTYRENLTTPLHPECLCPHGYTLPSSPCFFCPLLHSMFVPEVHTCLPQTVTLT